MDRKDDDNKGSRSNAEVDCKGEKRSNATHESKTDSDSRLYKKAKFSEAKPWHQMHIVMENCNGLVVDVETTKATSTAECEAAETMANKHLNRTAPWAKTKVGRG